MATESPALTVTQERATPRPRSPKESLLIRDLLKRSLRLYRRVVGRYRLRKRLAGTVSKKVVLGASGIYDVGWIPTEIEVLNVLNPDDWGDFFQPDSIDALLAEHVWEHFTLEEGLLAAKLCFAYLKPGGYLRVAVPDGLHPRPGYIEWVRVGGIGPGSASHKVLYTYRILSEVFERAGFQVRLYEYFDEAGTFHYQEWSPLDGTVHRSIRFDERNKDGKPNYTSIILDAIKEKAR